ncbi:hypothetical protein HDU86_005004 [Geranomyces michiganensis]|nr:hypothetical protein HDU86_005004 [Geranomyces michiganensis]
MTHRKPSAEQSTAEISRVQLLVRRNATPDKILALPTSLFALTTSLEHRLRETRRSYRAKSLLVHPDRCNHANAKSAFQAIQDAYEHIVLHGWVPPHLPAPKATSATSGNSGGAAAAAPTPPHPSAAARMAEMEAWMRRAHQSYFRGQRRCSGGLGPGGTGGGGVSGGGRRRSYRDLAEDVMSGLDAAGGWDTDDDEEEDEDDDYMARRVAPELMSWLKTVHQRSGLVGKKKKPLYSHSSSSVRNDDKDDYDNGENESLGDWTAAAASIPSFRPHYSTIVINRPSSRSSSSSSSTSSASSGDKEDDDDDDDDNDDGDNIYTKPSRPVQVKNPTLKRRRDLLRPSSPASAAEPGAGLRLHGMHGMPRRF